MRQWELSFGKASDKAEETHLCFHLSPSVFRCSLALSSRRLGAFSCLFFVHTHKPVYVLAKASLPSLSAKESWKHSLRGRFPAQSLLLSPGKQRTENWARSQQSVPCKSGSGPILAPQNCPDAVSEAGLSENCPLPPTVTAATYSGMVIEGSLSNTVGVFVTHTPTACNQSPRLVDIP